MSSSASDVDSFATVPGGLPVVVSWVAELYGETPSHDLWSRLDGPLRLALAQGWLLEETGDEDQEAAEALAERNSQHPDFAEMFAFYVGDWQEVFAMLEDDFGVLDQTIIAGANLEVVVLASAEDIGPVAGVGLMAHTFITRFTGDPSGLFAGDDGWVIAATARRLPVPGWPPSEEDIPDLLT